MMVLHKIEVNKEVYSITSQHNLFTKKQMCQCLLFPYIPFPGVYSLEKY